MRIAFVGTRGVPARYSGFETFVEQLGSRLAQRGHDVTVYCRRHHFDSHEPRYRGMRLVHVRGIATKHFDTITHTAVACLHTLVRRQDVVVMCISGNSPLACIPRVRGTKVVLTVDGSDWQRKKWGRLARAYIRSCEWLAVRLPNATITDSKVMHRYYLKRFGVDTDCIAYGSDMPRPEGDAALRRFGLRRRGYLLLVGRLVPENCPDHLVDAYERLQTDLDCVVVGDAPYQRKYIAELKRRGPHVRFTGYLFGDGYRELMHHAYAVVLCSEVGGTHPVLLEAMATGNCVVVNNTDANLEVVGDAGVPYDGARGADALREVLKSLIEEPTLVEGYRHRAALRASSLYSWDAVTDQYEGVFRRLTGAPASRDSSSVTADTRTS